MWRGSINDECYFSWQAQYLFGEVQVSLFVAGAVFGEIWNDNRSAKSCIFQYKMVVVGVKSNLGCEAGCGLTVSFSDPVLGSWSDPARIGPALEMAFHLFWTNFLEILENHFAWQAKYLALVAPRIVNSVSCVTRIRSIMRFIFRGRRSIWWVWTMTLRSNKSNLLRISSQTNL